MGRPRGRSAARESAADRPIDRGLRMPDSPANAGRARGALVEAAAIGGGFLAIAVALIWWAGGGRVDEPSTSRQAMPSTEVAGPLRDLLVGDRACAECHPGEHALHARSGHARTLRPAAG